MASEGSTAPVAVAAKPKKARSESSFVLGRFTVFEEKSMPASQWKGWTVRKADASAAGVKPSAATGTRSAPQVGIQGSAGKPHQGSRQSQLSTRDTFKQANAAVNVLRNFLNRTAAELDIDLKQVLGGGSTPQAARGPASSASGASAGSARTPSVRAGKAAAGSSSDAELAHLRQETKNLREKLEAANNKLNVAEAKLSRHDLVSKGIAMQKPPAAQ